ncbi:hypothetical protein FYC62_03490 [Pedobacter aquae]|uniref:DUF4279 domain-containing protein n=1 Tax=Pedobacter aquae TaxID=2605747 RepID=A0A5C0VFL9_9SPHI|nr:hypothetical protein [Pedobacter aquae]QEK50837.1 hypothetical protein FYC62_03490 [Pedobacter aquae]
MSCILSILGENFDVDQFVNKTNISFSIRHRGDIISGTSPIVRKSKFSMASISTSEKNYCNITNQIEETLDFLIKHKKKLQIINTFPSIDFATVNFGIDSTIDEEHLTQSFYFPLELIKICAELGISIETTLYKNDMEIILEKKHKKKSI